MTITSPGVYAMSAAEYLADPCPEPSLSSSIARILLAQSPLHAWHEHSRLGGGAPRRESTVVDIGTACHALILEGGGAFEIVNAPNWTKKDAQVSRAAARDAGKIPLLAEQWERVQVLAAALRHQLMAFGHPEPLWIDGGRPEQTILWQESGGVWCRARLDWLHDDYRYVDDLKTVSGSAHPDAFIRGPLYRDGYDVQAAFYVRGVKAVFGVETVCRFVVVEQEPPHAVSVVALDPMAMDLARRKVQRALTLWRICREENRWPGFPTATCWAEAPAWAVAQWEARETAASWTPTTQDDGRALDEPLTSGSQ